MIVYTLQSGKRLDEKQFIEYFEKKVFSTISRFNLIKKNDKVLVAASGGKDSNVCLYVLNKFGKKYHVQVEAITIEEGSKYRRDLIKILKKFCKSIGVKLNIYSFKEINFNIEKKLNKIKKLKVSNCYVCSILKRWLLNKKAKLLKATKVATGHNLDDESETFILNLIKGNSELIAKQGPGSGILENVGFVQRIKPLYFCSEKEIILYAKLKKIPSDLKPCPFRGTTLRIEIRNWLKYMEKKQPATKHAIVNSLVRILPLIKPSFNKNIQKCKVCKEPSNHDICKFCEISKKLK
jgi:uncharacterized protein (TIGR00269 family)